MAHSKSKQKRGVPFKLLINIGLLIALVVILIPLGDDLKKSATILKTANIGWILTGILFVIISYVCAAGAYLLLAKHTIQVFITFLVQVSSAFINRILPGGIGGLGLNVYYLTRVKHSSAEATSVVVMNSITSFISYGLLAGFALLSSATSHSSNKNQSIPTIVPIVVSILLVIGVIVFWRLPKLRKKVFDFLIKTKASLLEYRHKPWAIVGAVGFASLLTICYALTLYAVCHAFKVDITITQAFFVYTGGVIVGAITPTPGGLGGVEAGLYAGLVRLGNPADMSLAIVLTYRLLSYWLPIVPGYISFLWLEEKGIPRYESHQTFKNRSYLNFLICFLS